MLVIKGFHAIYVSFMRVENPRSSQPHKMSHKASRTDRPTSSKLHSSALRGITTANRQPMRSDVRIQKSSYTFEVFIILTLRRCNLHHTYKSITLQLLSVDGHHRITAFIAVHKIFLFAPSCEFSMSNIRINTVSVCPQLQSHIQLDYVSIEYVIPRCGINPSAHAV